jgi:hypothetical protein
MTSPSWRDIFKSQSRSGKFQIIGAVVVISAWSYLAYEFNYVQRFARLKEFEEMDKK